MSKIKICGIFRDEDVVSVNEALPDYVGFVFANSKRRVRVENAAFMKSQLDKSIMTVGVFVNSEKDIIQKIAHDGIIDLIQLHGDEDDDYIKSIAKLTGKPVIKAFSVKSISDVERAEKSHADFILFDSYSENMYGGSGTIFDWSNVMKVTRPYFLAGGLDYTSITYAYDALSPYCFDISSGVETANEKDDLKIKQVVNLVRSL